MDTIDEQTQTLTFNVSAEGTTQLIVESLAGDVSVQGWDQASIAIRPGKNQEDVNLADLLQVEQDGDQVKISAMFPGGGQWQGLLDGLKFEDLGQGLAELGRRLGRASRAGHVALDIRVPTHSSVTLRTASGDIRVRDVQGRVYIQSASGDVSLRDIAGSVLIKGASSDMDIKRLRGRLGVRTISGDLEIEQSELAALSAGSVSGDMSIKAALHPGEDYAFQTVSGDLDLDLPTEAGADVDFQTVSGDFHCELPHKREKDGRRHQRVRVNNGGGLGITIRTTSGDVSINAGGTWPTGAPLPADPEAADVADSDAPTWAASDAAGPALTRALRADEAQAAMQGHSARVAGGGDPAPTQRLPAQGAPSADGPRPSAEMSILEAIERGELSVDDGLRRLADLAN
jgi:DUF4097 and DUF4098 domain-containing protein YvlB